MAGHSHWAGIKHKKALVDNKRGKLWSKLSKDIIVAARIGGSDPDTNIRLRTAIADARAASMPKDNIERAIRETLTIWSFTDELQAQGDVEYFEDNYTAEGKEYEGMEIEYVEIPTRTTLLRFFQPFVQVQGHRT
ncbi:MAG: YebC/PmpR family DNA-binding transcriptional regulator, partial [Pirellulaceae bacterium]